MEKTKPAADNGGHREIIVADWKPHVKNSLQGFFSATLPSGMILHSLMLHERNGVRWVGLPSREWTDAAGVKQFAKLIEFRGHTTANKFRDLVLAALDRYLEGASE